MLCTMICASLKLKANSLRLDRLKLRLPNEWMKPKKVRANIVNMLGTCQLRKDPLGVVLLIGPWNFPFSLLVNQFAGAIAAGNCVILKPSEISSHTAKVLEDLVPKYVGNDCAQVINGGVCETTCLLKQRFDHIMYTGGSTVARKIMRAASEHLTPVTLELGGKSPAIVDSTCDFEVVADRIAWSKFLNCGQMCISVDYVLCVGGCEKQLAEHLRKSIVKFYGISPENSGNYGRIINQRHFERIRHLMHSLTAIHGGGTNSQELYIEPTLYMNVPSDHAIMKEEIFGPLLPIIPLDNLKDAVDYINQREKPLALYVFLKSKERIENILDSTSSGGVCVNDTLMHIGVPNLPFGGVGESGMGCYTGKFSLKTFSHRKACLIKSQNFEFLNKSRYPPYDGIDTMFKVTDWLNKDSAFPMDSSLRSIIAVILIVLVVAVCAKQIF